MIYEKLQDDLVDEEVIEEIKVIEIVVKKESRVNFNVKGDFSVYWFSNYIDIWEPNTFHILNYYAPRYGREKSVHIGDVKRNIYVDIGSWIGPTVMYSALFYAHVVAIEPDPVALQRLKSNLSVNNYSNITLIEKALTIVNDKILFGGNGSLGNSESTMLVGNSQYIDERWGGRWTSQERNENIIEVDGITIYKLINDNGIDPTEIALMKMDIEGGEFILIPELINFLYEYDIPLYISLHYVFLKESHILFILNILFDSYYNCYIFDENGKKEQVNREKVIKERSTMLVFENVKNPKFNKKNKQKFIKLREKCKCEII